MDKTTESLILEALNRETCMRTVNNYGETLLHVAASNGFPKIVKEILKKEIWDIDYRNVFGWTPLMQAIRNGKINCAKILVENGAKVSNSTYLGMSAIGLATAVSKEMFEIIYEAFPSALEIAAQDEVCPLSIAAMKNDKELFFRLLELGLDVSKANNLAQLMIKSSVIPEISALMKVSNNFESFWDDSSDNIEIIDELENNDNETVMTTRKHPNLPKIIIKDVDVKLLQENNETSDLDLSPSDKLRNDYRSLISPTLTYNFDGAYPLSPKLTFPNEENNESVSDNEKSQEEIHIPKNDIFNFDSEFERPLQRCQNIRPPDLELDSEPDDLNNTLSFVPEYSPKKSPNVPPEIEDEDAIFEDITPTQAQAMSPPVAFIVTPRDAPIAFLLYSYGLGRFIPIFLEQEVDADLFVTLNNEDLEEIGIESELERRVILSAIDEIQKAKIFSNSKKTFDRCL